MASDNDASRRKHRRSPSDEEAEKSSKRQKHRHHRHHRHHRSKKRDEENKQADDEVVDLPPPPPTVASTVAVAVADADANRFGGDDDVEEGEILEEAGELRNEKSDSKYLEVAVSKAENGIVSDSNICDQVKNGVSLHDNVGSNPEVLANGRFGYEDHKDDKRHHRRSRSPLKGMHKWKDYVGADSREDDESKCSDLRKSSSSGSGEGVHKMLAPSLSHGRYRDKDDRRNRSMSREPTRERSCSRSIMDEEALLNRRHDREMPESDADDDGRTKHSKDWRYSSRDVGRDTDMENGTNHNIYLGEEYRHHSGDARDAEWGKKREKDTEHRRDNDSEKSRDDGLDRDRRREKEKERIRDKDVDWDHRREKERERIWEIGLDRGGRREMERERSWDRDWRSEKELDAERRRKIQRDESREWDVEGERRRQRDRDTSRDKYTARVSERERDRDREREKDRNRYRDSARDHDQETEREKERHGRNDRSRDKGRDIKNDSGKVHNFSIDSSEQNQDKPKRFEDEYKDDDCEEGIAFKLDEEEDLNKIKEESRKRRQAILEKHKNKELQKQIESHAADVVKDMPVEGPGQLVSSANVVPENVDDMFASFSVRKSPSKNGTQDSVRPSGVLGLGEGSPKSERSDEKYCDDIFGETPVGVRKFGKGDGLPIMRSGLHDNWDDAEGYYSYRFGEILDGRYEIVAAHGKGVFSTVVRAKDLKASKEEPEEVAIKIIRNNETMRKAGDLEVSILKKLAGADPENKLHCVRFLSSFKYRNHLCLVFESLHMNLREVLKKFGRNIGLKLTAVRVYAKQLFIALKHLRNNGVLHSDIKPDNMLVNEAKNVLKLCDFGNAMFSGKNEVTPYLVSRFYRAPEIILGLQYDHPMDIWSVGCCLYELYTGKVLFPGPSNNDMLRLHMELKGSFPKKMLKKGAFVDQHFDLDLNFHATEEDPVTKKTVKRLIVNIKPKDIGFIITSSPGEDPKMSADFKDLLERIFVLDPEKRLTVKAALAHSFITGK